MSFDSVLIQAILLRMGVSLVYAVIALVVGVLAVRFVDKVILAKIDLEEEIRKGNIAAGIFGGALILFVAILLAGALGQ